VEASDDICYRLMDLEDAVRLDILKIDEVKAMLFPIIEYYYESLNDTKRTKDFLDKYSSIN
jgi:dGTP triphosphohydrolase